MILHLMENRSSKFRPPILHLRFHLDRCMRVLPHLQNTGGFFVAVLEKSAPCPWENKKKYEGEAEEGSGAETGEQVGASFRGNWI